MDPNELRQQRADLIAQQRAYIDAHPDFTAEDQTAVSAMDADLDRLEARISSIEANERRMASVASTVGTIETAEAGHPVDANDPLVNAEYEEAFWGYVRGGVSDPRADASVLGVGTSTTGGFLVPTLYEQRLIQDAPILNPIRSLATVRRTSMPGLIPALNTRPTFGLISESGDFPATNPTYTQKGYNAYKFGGIILVSDELLQDSMFDLPAHIAQLYGVAAAQVEGPYFTMGTGSSQPSGYAYGAQKGIDMASKTVFAADELIDLQGSLKAPYQRNAVWTLPVANWTAIRKLKNGDGDYLIVPGLRSGESDMLLGKPVVQVEDVAALGSNNRPIVYGDLSYFNILDRSGIAIQRLNELYASKGQVGFKCWFRTDSLLEVPEAVKYAKCPA